MRKILGGIMLAATFGALFTFSVVSVGMLHALIGWAILLVVFGWLLLMIHLLHN